MTMTTSASEAGMTEETQKERLALAASSRIARENLSEVIRIDPRTARFCCGHVVEPHLAEIRDPSGPSLFVSVWRCAYCGRASS